MSLSKMRLPKQVLFALLLALAVPTFAADRARIQMRLGEVESDPSSSSVWDLHHMVTDGGIPDDLLPRLKRVLHAVVGAKRARAHTRYRAALALDLLGETSEAIQAALLSGMRDAFPLRQGMYRNFDRSAAEYVRTVRNPSEAIVHLLIDLVRHGGDNRGCSVGLEILIEWGNRGEPIRGWIDAQNLRAIEGAVWTVQFWAGESRRHAGRARQGSGTRAANAREYLAAAERDYDTMKKWWPTLAHTAPVYEEVDAEAVPAAAEPVALEAQERLYVLALAYDEIKLVEEAVRKLLELEEVTFSTLVALDGVRVNQAIDGALKERIRAFLRVRILPHLQRLLHEEPAPRLDVPGLRDADPTSACLILLAASGEQKK